MTTHPSTWPAGTRTPAGLFHSTVLPDADFETYSEAGFYYDLARQKWHGPPHASMGKKGLPVVGAAIYATHPTTEVLTFTYDLKDGTGVRSWAPGWPAPLRLHEYICSGGLLEAWNSAFEWWIWNMVCVRRYGWPALPIEQTRCAMSKARAFSLPGKLELAGAVLGLEVQKDKDGKRLLDKFSVPRNPTAKDKRLRTLLTDDPADAAKLWQYNRIDIVTEAEASSRCPDLEGDELEFWIVDQKVNRRGVHMDAESLEACARMVELCLERYDSEMNRLTGGVVTRASQLPSLRAFLATRGLHVREGKGSMDDAALTALLSLPGLDPLAKRALEIRQLVGSASVKKVFAMRNTLSPWGRIHDLFNYHGARTGRPTGEGVQPTNLAKAGPKVYRCTCGRHSGLRHRLACPWCGAVQPPTLKAADWGPDAMEDVLLVIKTGSLATVEYLYDDAMLCVSGCLRGLFTAAPGCDLIASDFSAIESVVTACLAGEDWRVDVFRTHGKNYEMATAQITGIPFAEIMAHAGYTDTTGPEWWKHRATKGPHHPMRQTIGKVSELASGFGGGVGAWLRFMQKNDPPMSMPEDEIKAAIKKWRAASPAIVEFWGGQERGDWGFKYTEYYGLEGMAICAVMTPNQDFPVRRKDGTHTGITFRCDGAVLYCILPSGRALHYHRPQLEPNTRGWGGDWQLSYEGYNSNPEQGAIGWVRLYIYGGKFCENVVQAVARDIQRHAMIQAERQAYYIVLHVYDEIVAEVPQGWGSVEGLESIMGSMPPWAVYKGAPWPIKAAGGWRGKRYRKD